MILLSKLNGEQFALNCDLIETMHSNPDTTIRLSNGTTYIVSDSVQEVIEKIKEYRRSIFGKTLHDMLDT